MKTEVGGFGGVGRGCWRERGLQVSAGLDLISDQMMREAEQRLCGRYPDGIGHFRRDGLASPGDGEHPIEIARPSVKTVQLANEAKLFDRIANLLRELQTSPGCGLRGRGRVWCGGAGTAPWLRWAGSRRSIWPPDCRWRRARPIDRGWRSTRRPAPHRG